jgi:hypothetical protein
VQKILFLVLTPFAYLFGYKLSYKNSLTETATEWNRIFFIILTRREVRLEKISKI